MRSMFIIIQYRDVLILTPTNLSTADLVGTEELIQSSEA
jgi:hypothetical protein